MRCPFSGKAIQKEETQNWREELQSQNILNIGYTVILYYYSGYNRTQCSTFCTLMTQECIM